MQNSPVISKWFLVLRSVFLSVILIIAHGLLEIPTSLAVLLFFVVLGTIVGSKLGILDYVITRGNNRAKFNPPLIIFIIFVWFAVDVVIRILGDFSFSATFTIYNLREHLRVIWLVLSLASLVTASSIKYRYFSTLELISYILFFLSLLSPHRNLRFDMPKFVNELSWSVGLTSLSLLILSGIFLSSLSLLILGISPFKTISHTDTAPIYKEKRWGILTSFILLILGIFILIGNSIYSQYSSIPKGKFSNGVGEETRSGSSPLGFHSALGGTNQPSALVRLDSDYTENPFSPMLYMRESALSEMRENEIVIAPPEFDSDIIPTNVFKQFEKKVAEDSDRKKVTQSVYILSDQQTPFAVDYPISLTPLKVKDNNRFKAAYKAISLAPVFSLDSISDAEVGDSKWSLETRSHYLVTHADPRYGELAFKITEGAVGPIRKAKAITQYLSKTAIYTLSPNHEVTPGGDPVAPFLFGDHRGYCVHFAHATVYMLRAIGIPSRIGTGYLTDLSQAKDGHVLLRMSDRHAWAEVYINGIGWVPFDTQPEQVESHAETEVDQKLLEELMGLLEPDEDILPKDIAKEEMVDKEISQWSMPSKTFWAILLGLVLSFLTLTKIYLRYSYKLFNSAEKKAYCAYRAHASRLMDAGYKREIAETRIEYHKRLQSINSSFSLSHPFVKSIYSSNPPLNEDILVSVKEDRANFNKFPFWRRLVAIFNPASVFAFWSNSKW